MRQNASKACSWTMHGSVLVWTLRRRTVSADRWGVQGGDVQIFTVSL